MKHKTNKRLLTMLMAIVLAFSHVEVASAITMDDGIATITDRIDVVPEVAPPTSYTEVYERIIAWQDKIPTGTPWTDYTPYDLNKGNGYEWKGGLIDGKRMVNYGCAAFACILSDAAFGNLPASTIYRGNFAFKDIRVGDILRINNNSHSVIVLQTNAAGLVIAEGNNSGKVYWGRTISKEDALYADYLVTRYPKGFVSADEEGAHEIVDQGKEGNFTWTLTKSGILSISGKGAMPNFSLNDDYLPSWGKTTYPVYSIVIQSGITTIGNYAFYQSSAMSVDIPSTVTKIGESAFWKSNLISVSIPGNVTIIGSNSFRECPNLASLNFAEGTTMIGDNAFRGCNNISGILNIPASVTTVGSGAFLSCAELMSVQFASSSHAVTIGDNAFMQCWKMLSIKLPENLTSISNGLFQSCQMLTYLYIPASVKSIELGMIGRDSPFLSTPIMQLDFGGSEAIWNSIGGNKAISNAYLSDDVIVNFNVPLPTTPSEPVPTVTPVATDTPAATETPEVTDAPAATETPVETEAPEVTDAPAATETPVVTEAPEVTDAPAATETPVVTEAPEVTDTPVATDTPAATETPEVTKAPVATETPVVTAEPATTETPEATAEPVPTDTPIVAKSKLIYAKKQKTSGLYRYLYNSKNQKVDKFKLKAGKLTYKRKRIKNWKSVRWADFNKDGNIIVVLKNGNYYSVNHKNLKVKKLGTKAKSRKRKKTLVTHIVIKSGAKKNVAHK